jgi:hypothetical protein
MEYVAITLIAIGVVVFVAYPLFGRQRRLYHIEDAFEAGDARQLSHLNFKKARIEENLRELDFEHEMGKLSEQDYAALREGYAKEAEEAAKAVDKFKIREEIEELIEGEVRSRRRIK